MRSCKHAAIEAYGLNEWDYRRLIGSVYVLRVTVMWDVKWRGFMKAMIPGSSAKAGDRSPPAALSQMWGTATCLCVPHSSEPSKSLPLLTGG